ncbi:MAG: metal-dependent protease of the PAD1/JAB1 superfamily, partial [Lachnospiraceae bacterium]|nr:metal-dependent protease of the PAD1/JAB1 superfamily [Lachnospiraceae bacterium]
MDDFEIEIQSETTEKSAPLQLPVNFLTIGEIENDDVKVYIKQDVYKELEEYACSDTDHELGTIILGNYAEELGKMHVVISEFIYAKYTDASASTLTFTHETWDYVHKEHEKNHPDTKIVGWQHTHPGYGVFLSNYDMFIQENFFNVPFQVAYVIDPVQHIRGFFQWKNGKVEKLKGFYIYDGVGKNIKIDQPKQKKKEEVTEESAVTVSKYQPIVLGALA